MLLLKADKLKKWLVVTRKNQAWLADMYGVRPSYISQLMHNRCHISGNFIGFILTVTQMNFHDLFYYDAQKDPRGFYGKDISFDGRVLNSNAYYKLIDGRLKKKKECLTSTSREA